MLIDILLKISVALLYGQIVLYRNFLLLKFGRGLILNSSWEGAQFKKTVIKPDASLLRLTLLLNIILIIVLSIVFISISGWFIILSFFIALFLGRYTDRDMLNGLLFFHPTSKNKSPYITIIWKDKNCIIKKIDYTLMVFVFLFFLIASITGLIQNVIL